MTAYIKLMIIAKVLFDVPKCLWGIVCAMPISHLSRTEQTLGILQFYYIEETTLSIPGSMYMYILNIES